MDQLRPHYFNTTSFLAKGSQVEVSSDEDGLNGAWFVATVIHPPPSISTTKKNKYTRNNLVYVEYHNLLSEDGSSRRLREYANVSYVRPSPRPDTNAAAPHFQLNDLVDAFYRDGWWTGVITAVVDSSNFVVTFQNPPDQIPFNSSDLRVHRRWDGGRWVQPEIQRTAGLMFTVGKKVEVCFEGENLRDAWFPATVVENLGNNSFLVEYQQPGIGDEATILKVTVDCLHIRPSPPHLRDKNFVLLEKVDAYYDFGWWSGVITKQLADNRYNVFFKNTKKEREFDCSRVRPHMEWKGGQWFTTSQGETDGIFSKQIEIEQTTPSIDIAIGKQSTSITKQTDVDSNDTISLPSNSMTLENEIRSEDPSLSTNDLPPPSESLRGKRGKNAQLARKKGTESRSSISLGEAEGAKDDLRRQEDMEKVPVPVPVIQCNVNANGMAVSEEQLSNIAQGVGLVVTDKEEEGVAETPTPKRKRGRPPRQQGTILTPETPTPVAVAGVCEMERSASSVTKALEQPTTKLRNDLNVESQPQPQVGKKYSSMKGKGGKRRTISINSEEDDTQNSRGLVQQSPTTAEVEVEADCWSFGDKFPFKINSPALWKTIESMEAFRKIPQKPHFGPLEGTKESGREGAAISSMVTFSNVLETTSALRSEDPRSAIQERLDTVAELETYGFEVGLIRERLTGLLLIKDRQEELEQRSKGAIEKLEEERREVESMDADLGQFDKEFMELEETRRQLLLEKEKHESQMNTKAAAADTIHQHLTQATLDFAELAAAPFRV